MKKLYIAPQAEIMETMTENIMATPLEDLQFRNIWAEEEEE